MSSIFALCVSPKIYVNVDLLAFFFSNKPWHSFFAEKYYWNKNHSTIFPFQFLKNEDLQLGCSGQRYQILSHVAPVKKHTAMQESHVKHMRFSEGSVFLWPVQHAKKVTQTIYVGPLPRALALVVNLRSLGYSITRVNVIFLGQNHYLFQAYPRVSKNQYKFFCTAAYCIAPKYTG